MGRKIFLGVLAWTPIVLVVALAMYLVAAGPAVGGGHFDVSVGSWEGLSPQIRHLLIALFGGATLIALLQIVFSIVFIVDASTNAKLRGAPLALWAIGFIFFGELLFPIYWLLHVARERQPVPNPTAAGTTSYGGAGLAAVPPQGR